MKAIHSSWALLPLVAMLTACGGESAPSAPSTTAPAAEVIAPVATPAPTTADAPLIAYQGVGEARFGQGADAVRKAWNSPLELDRVLEEGEVCAYLVPVSDEDSRPALSFMIEEARFVRLDVNNSRYEAPEGGRVGATLDELKVLYQDRAEISPHKYDEQMQYFRVPGPDGSAVNFELDANGVVFTWYIGVEPQVDYVEGCS